MGTRVRMYYQSRYSGTQVTINQYSGTDQSRYSGTQVTINQSVQVLRYASYHKSVQVLRYASCHKSILRYASYHKSIRVVSNSGLVLLELVLRYSGTYVWVEGLAAGP